MTLKNEKSKKVRLHNRHPFIFRKRCWKIFSNRHGIGGILYPTRLNSGWQEILGYGWRERVKV
jgi:hypothetical protein